MLGGEKKVRHDWGRKERERDTQGSWRRSRRKIAVADDTGQGRDAGRDVKNGSVPNECHPVRKTKDAEGGRRAKYEERCERERGTREVPHVDISYIRRNNRFVAMFLFQLSPFFFFLVNCRARSWTFSCFLILKSVLSRECYSCSPSFKTWLTNCVELFNNVKSK